MAAQGSKSVKFIFLFTEIGYAGQYNPKALQALDTIVSQAAAAGVKLILPFANNWQYSEGKLQVSCNETHINVDSSNGQPVYSLCVSSITCLHVVPLLMSIDWRCILLAVCRLGWRAGGGVLLHRRQRQEPLQGAHQVPDFTVPQRANHSCLVSK